MHKKPISTCTLSIIKLSKLQLIFHSRRVFKNRNVKIQSFEYEIGIWIFLKLWGSFSKVNSWFERPEWVLSPSCQKKYRHMFRNWSKMQAKYSKCQAPIVRWDFELLYMNIRPEGVFQRWNLFFCTNIRRLLWFRNITFSLDLKGRWILRRYKLQTYRFNSFSWREKHGDSKNIIVVGPRFQHHFPKISIPKKYRRTAACGCNRGMG